MANTPNPIADLEGLTEEDKMQFAEAAVNSTMSRAEFASSLNIKVYVLQGWITEYRKRIGVFKPAPKRKAKPERVTVQQAISDGHSVAYPVVKAQPDPKLEEAYEVIRELEGKLRDAQTKISSLQNVIYILGHQVGDPNG
ncbi:hypothetical protein EVB27_095 [Rhizobium phage RHph_TM16]|nr:hypothetical protein EVB27_095 [Rhizobium phage RHph_TM16]